MTTGPLKAIALDFGHTVIDERINVLTVTVHREEHLMPGVREALATLSLPIADLPALVTGLTSPPIP